MTLADAIERGTAAAPALLTASGRVLTYGDLAARGAALRAWLRATGIDRRGVVALAMRGGPAAVEATLAAASEAACAPLPFRQTAAERLAALDRLDPGLLLADAPSPDDLRLAAERGIPVVRLHTDEAGTLDLAATMAPAPPAAAAGVRVQVGGLGLLLPTSGTTGASKLVPLPAAALLRAAELVAGTLGLRAGDRCLDAMPLHHTHGLVGGALASLWAGASAIVPPGFSDAAAAAGLRRLGATWYTAVPAIHARVAELAEAGALRGERLRFVRSTSARLPGTLRWRLEAALGVPVVEAYALTEAPGQIASGVPGEPVRPGSVGRAYGCELDVLDSGEVLVRGDHVTPGYLEMAGAALRPLAGGWLRTGDLGVLGGDGSLRLVGRVDDVINRAGEKVLPAEVEDALLRCPGVRDAAVAGLADPVLGEAVGALVAGDVDVASLRARLAETLSPHKVPDVLRLAGRVPRSATGKVDRRALAAALAEGRRPAPGESVIDGTAAAWRSVLGEGAGLDDHFLDLGGASLQAAQIEHLVAERFGVPLPARSVLAGGGTIRALAEVVERLLAGA
ncbi:MAG TPA: non-ribosomal peptide synthetase [Candidatus Dormibacteraeota bacterium]|nr:non-ribosomal peptide synthetase [Candidatus Dormibacteraeota bacterium]